MWDKLEKEKKQKYQELILAFASLTEVFAQKKEEDKETVFQKIFDATAEDIGNTAYDASLVVTDEKDIVHKYLIGIKTFQGSGMQKIAQFKRDSTKWAADFQKLQLEAEKGKSVEEIVKENKDLYLKIAHEVSRLRNLRIDSAIENLKGFRREENEVIESVYHYLMPNIKEEQPVIEVGEMSYEKIDIDNIKLLKANKKNIAQNIYFEDGKHKYRFTSADSQLFMEFKKKSPKFEAWKVKYLDNPFRIFEKIAQDLSEIEKENLSEIKKEKIESHCWRLYVVDEEIPLFSSLNAGYALSAKNPEQRIDKFIELKNKYITEKNASFFDDVEEYLKKVKKNKNKNRKREEVDFKNRQLARKREELMSEIKNMKDEELHIEMRNLLYRDPDEMYIAIPNSRQFHLSYPNFFSDKGILDPQNTNKVIENSFSLVFEPSGEKVEAFITQSAGKGLETKDKQTIMGDWILRKIFQLPKYTPLTREKLEEIGINGIRLTKYHDSIHLSFIWIDDNHLPDDYWK